VLFGYQASFLKERKKILQNPKGLAFTALDADLSLLYFLLLWFPDYPHDFFEASCDVFMSAGRLNRAL